MSTTERLTPAIDTWLRESDPAIAWQYERDVIGAPASRWVPQRARVERDGWGRALLDRQDPSGTWADGLYTPKWTSTTYTLLVLRRFGLEPTNEAARSGCRQLLDRARWVDGGVSYWQSHTYPERCVNGMVLSVCAYFGLDDDRVDMIAETLIASPMEIGGWNCEDVRGDTHPSFHTTISVLEALCLWRDSRGSSAADGVIDAAHDMLLDHRLFRSHRTGEVIDDEWTAAHFPPRWHYDILRGLDHLRSEGLRDERAQDGVDVVVARQRSDGAWPKGKKYGGVEFFPLETDRMRGRWNTMRALRVLRWWADG